MNRIKEILETNSYSDKEEQLIMTLLSKKFDGELREELSEELASKYNISKGKKEKKSTYKRLIIISTIAASLVIGWLTLSPFYSITNVESRALALLSDDASFHPGITKGIGNETLRSDAIESFNKGDYSKAVSSFLQIEEQTEEDRYYTALAYLKNKQYDAASMRFQSLSGSRQYREEVAYYLVISQILNHQLQEALKTINLIKADEYKYRDAQELRSLIQ